MTDKGEVTREQIYKACLEALFRRDRPSYRYAILPNAIVIPDRPADQELILHVLHEWAHAQLSNTPLGLTIQLLRKLAGLIQRRIFPPLSETLSEMYRANLLDRESYVELFCFGRTPRDTALQQRLIEGWRARMALPDMMLWIDGFDTLCARSRRLWDRWRLAQELVALGWSQSIALGTIEDEASVLEQVTQRLNIQSDKDGLRKAAQHQSTQLKAESSLYGRAQRMFDEFTVRGGASHAPLIAALAATHFHYPSCHLVDMSESHFDEWLRDGRLNPTVRLERLLPYAQMAARFPSEPHLGPELLRIACGDLPTLSPLDEQSKFFGAWTRRFIWGSRLFESCVDQPASEFIVGDALIANQKLDHDHSQDFKMFEVNQPAWVFEKDRVVEVSKAGEYAFQANLIDAYELERTSLLLSTLRKSVNAVMH
jgi:hypothetical protein